MFGCAPPCAADWNTRSKWPSGAGHDAAVFAKMDVPTGMIFVRNEQGSHNPDEAMTLDDFGIAARALLGLLMDFPLP